MVLMMDFSARLRSLRTTLLIGMGSLLLVGVLLDFWLLRMSHRPLKKAIDTLRSSSLEAPSSLGQLEHSVRQLVFSNEALTQQVNHQKDELRRAAYQLLMNRDMHTEQDMERSQQQLEAMGFKDFDRFQYITPNAE